MRRGGGDDSPPVEPTSGRSASAWMLLVALTVMCGGGALACLGLQLYDQGPPDDGGGPPRGSGPSGATSAQPRSAGNGRTPTPAPPRTSGSVQIQTTACSARLAPEDVNARLVHSVVMVLQGRSLGSGFVIADGWIVTNHHVLDSGSDATVVFPNGAKKSGRVRWTTVVDDLALVHVADWPGSEIWPTPLASWDTALVGQEVFILGAPQALEWSFSKGVVSAKRLHAANDNRPAIQTDAAVNGGNSGGPLADACGRAIGIVSYKRANAENLNFARPIDQLGPGLQQLGL